MLSRKQPRTFVLFALALGALGGLAAVPAHAAVEATHTEIVARGSGEVHARPDSVRVDVGVEAEATTLDEVRTTVDGAMEKVIRALKAMDVGGIAIETRSIHFSPVYGPPRDNRPQAIVGYTGSNHVLVTAEDVPDKELAARSARIVDTALAAGANNVGAIDFYLADPSEAEDKALTLAVQSAESDARTMAKAADVTLAGPVSIEENSPSRGPRALVLAVPMVATPVEVGDIVIQVSVTAKYAFR
jgi:uncharacterized protein YggE